MVSSIQKGLQRSNDLGTLFPEVAAFKGAVPCWRISDIERPSTHRFFDSSPLSPSGRFVAYTQMPYDNKVVRPGHFADVMITDLATGEIHKIGSTLAWDLQVGAHVQWGATDDSLLFNSMQRGEWEPFGVVANIFEGTQRRLQGPIYSISPDGKFSLSPCLKRIKFLQKGYGVVVPREELTINSGASSEDGLYEVDLETGQCCMGLSFEEIAKELNLEDYIDLNRGRFFGFHTKFSPDGKKIMFIMRFKPSDSGASKSFMITMDRGGNNLNLALCPDHWERGGHHPSWHSDSEHITMNLVDDADVLRFVKFPADGSGPITQLGGRVLGSGHPTVGMGGTHLLTDASIRNRMGRNKSHAVPIRLIDLEKGKGQHLFSVRVCNKGMNFGPTRIDPHPAWDHSSNFVVFNGLEKGTRAVFIADLRPILGNPVVEMPLSEAA